tara:strand:+ start:170 stop:562 length:393 start_codon:yes stop_codon:yes gene_type:complete
VPSSWLYFRNVTDQDADDSNGTDLADSLCIRGDMIRAMFPETDERLGIMYEPTLAAYDHLVLSVSTHRHKEAMEAIAFAARTPGFHVIADMVTTTYLTSDAGADETITAKTIVPEITGIVSLSIADAFTP